MSTTPKTFPGALRECFAHVGDMREALRSQGQSASEIEAATEQMVRHYLEPFVPNEKDWPQQHFYRCWDCQDTGAILRFNVRNKHRTVVTVAEPCRCARGARFQPPQRRAEDFTKAGKTQKPMTRVGR